MSTRRLSQDLYKSVYIKECLESCFGQQDKLKDARKANLGIECATEATQLNYHHQIITTSTNRACMNERKASRVYHGVSFRVSPGL